MVLYQALGKLKALPFHAPTMSM